MSLHRRMNNGGSCRLQFWFVISGSLLLWFLVFYYNSMAYETSMNKFQLIINSVMSPPLSEPSSVLANGNITTGNVEKIHVITSENKNVDVNMNKTDVQTITSEVRDVPFNVTYDKMVTSDNVEHKIELDNIIEPIEKRIDVEERKDEHEHVVVLDPCYGRHVYVHELPRRFNADMINECRTLNLWADMCPYVQNSGLGQRIGNSQGAFIGRGWFTTDQFTLDVIFHNRMKQYRCLTKNSSMASAVYVPFYAGLDVTRYLWGYNTSTRDAASIELFKWLTTKPEWEVLGGRDHFLVAGRISWDFRRLRDRDSDWGNSLMTLPEAKNMSLLVLEKSPWHRNDFAIPYPTYFHPSSDGEVSQWQNRMRKVRKKCLFSFAGAARPNMNDSIRGHIIHQCQASKNCRLLDCSKGLKLCYKPSNVMKLFQSSYFCLQPPGDSFTRKSAFDSILAGCIPIFFHPGSAYVQYIWHLPKDFTKYSVLISENEVRKGKVKIESVLSRIPKEKVIAMREEVVRLIPRVIYADPKSKMKTFEDAFDVSVNGVIEKVNKVRMELRQGIDSAATYDEKNSWKYNLFGTEEKHEWDHFFRKQEQ